MLSTEGFRVGGFPTFSPLSWTGGKSLGQSLCPSKVLLLSEITLAVRRNSANTSIQTAQQKAYANTASSFLLGLAAFNLMHPGLVSGEMQP